MIHLDTSYLIRLLLPGSPEDRQVRTWLRDRIPLSTSAIAWAEFLCGPLEPAQIDLAVRLLSEWTPFTAEDSVLAARLFNLAGRRRGTLIDCMIAASAMGAGAALATVNAGDFMRLTRAGLELYGA